MIESNIKMEKNQTLEYYNKNSEKICRRYKVRRIHRNAGDIFSVITIRWIYS